LWVGLQPDILSIANPVGFGGRPTSIACERGP
jgi:hypothetical protein